MSKKRRILAVCFVTVARGTTVLLESDCCTSSRSRRGDFLFAAKPPLPPQQEQEEPSLPVPRKPAASKKRPHAGARALSGVFGAVGDASRRASRALRNLGGTLEHAAERAESVAKLVDAAGRRAEDDEKKRRDDPRTRRRTFPLRRNESFFRARAPAEDESLEDSDDDDSEEESFEESSSSGEGRRWRVGRFFLVTFLRELEAWRFLLFLMAGRWSRSSRRSRRFFAAALVLVVLVCSERRFFDSYFGRSRGEGTTKATTLKATTLRLSFDSTAEKKKKHKSEPESFLSSSSSALSSSSFPASPPPPLGAGADHDDHRKHSVSFFNSMSGELWRAAAKSASEGEFVGGLGAHLGAYASDSFRLALGRGLASIADVSTAVVDLGDEPPHLASARRLRKAPRALEAALLERGADPARLVAFELETSEWRFRRRDDDDVYDEAPPRGGGKEKKRRRQKKQRGAADPSRSFLAADLVLKNTLKYAVPRLGLVVKEAVLEASRVRVAVEFVPTYPFVRYAAATFAERPSFVATSFVGSTSRATDDDLVDFEPFAQIIDDELKAALPVGAAYAFDLGHWLTDCGVRSQFFSPDALLLGWPGSDDEPAKAQAAAAAPNRDHYLLDDGRDAAFHHDDLDDDDDPENGDVSDDPENHFSSESLKKQKRGGPFPPPRRRGPFAGVRRWFAARRERRRLKTAQKNMPTAAPSLASQEAAARRRLEDERKKLLEAATAVRRERDNLVAAAQSTRKALSDRLFVAFKLQLAQEFQSLTTMLRQKISPPLSPPPPPPKKKKEPPRDDSALGASARERATKSPNKKSPTSSRRIRHRVLQRGGFTRTTPIDLAEATGIGTGTGGRT